MSYKGQKLLKPVFDPMSQPGWQSRFQNRPFDDFFGSARHQLIVEPERSAQTIEDKKPVQKFKSFQSPNVIPARKK